MNTRAGISRVAIVLAAALVLTAMGAHAEERDHGGGAPRGAAPGGGQQHFDARYSHNQYYPQRGAAVAAVPRGYAVEHRGAHYYYSGGVWYRPYGPRYVVVGPPFGVFVPVLPPFYTTIWWGGIPYYYANDTYYVWRGSSQGYEVVAPPDDSQVSTAPLGAEAPVDDVFVYPKNGQSDEQSNRDRYECHRWASDQTGFDPTQPGGQPPGQAPGSRAEYQRAMTACLEGRGYSVR